jgi:hypothetical protein
MAAEATPALLPPPIKRRAATNREFLVKNTIWFWN